MKKLLSLIAAVAFALSFAAVAVAAEKPAAEPAMKPEPAKMAEPAKKAEHAKKAVKAKSKQIAGTIETLDEAAGTFSVKGKKETVSLKAGEKVKLAEFAVGEKVLVKYADGTASSVKKVAMKKKAARKAEKKEAAPAPAAPAAK